MTKERINILDRILKAISGHIIKAKEKEPYLNSHQRGLIQSYNIVMAERKALVMTEKKHKTEKEIKALFPKGDY